MYKSTVIVLCIPAIDEFTRFWVIDVNSDETAWKKTEIWSESTKSGNAAGIVETKFKKSLNNLGISKTKDCSWTYISGINHVNIAAPIIINIEKDRIIESDSEIL